MLPLIEFLITYQELFKGSADLVGINKAASTLRSIFFSLLTRDQRFHNPTDPASICVYTSEFSTGFCFQLKPQWRGRSFLYFLKLRLIQVKQI